jgi:hypothetical protein
MVVPVKPTLHWAELAAVVASPGGLRVEEVAQLELAFLLVAGEIAGAALSQASDRIWHRAHQPKRRGSNS